MHVQFSPDIKILEVAFKFFFCNKGGYSKDCVGMYLQIKLKFYVRYDGNILEYIDWLKSKVHIES